MLIARQLRNLADRFASEELDEDRYTAISSHLTSAESVFPESRSERTVFAERRSPEVRHPIAQGSSAVYPPLKMSEMDGGLEAKATFGPAWEGPPDLVHGGYLAAGFDMVFSSLAHEVMGHSVTRRLRVRYLRPTFVGSELTYEVQSGEQNGRLLELKGRLLCEGRTTMRAVAQFASLDETRFADRRSVR